MRPLSPPGRAGPVGIGLKAPHVEHVLADGARVDFFEVHAENYMVDGGPFLRHLDRIRERWPLSLHGVGLSIGGEQAPDARHLDRLAALIGRYRPDWFSEHLAWSGHDGRWFNDLLPLPYDAPTLRRVCAHVDQVQARLGRRLLLENPATYVEFTASTMDEGEFLSEVVHRTGCGLLMDLNNACVSAVNHGRDPWRLVAALPADAVGEIHLAGHAEDRDAGGAPLLIDDHGSAVGDPVWDLYGRALRHLESQRSPASGAIATLIERDNDLPALAALEAEAGHAVRVQQRIRQAGTDRRCAA
ncbi:MAG: DUF692 domain-containing protein [Burkholderiaceae bacterium]